MLLLVFFLRICFCKTLCSPSPKLGRLPLRKKGERRLSVAWQTPSHLGKLTGRTPQTDSCARACTPALKVTHSPGAQSRGRAASCRCSCSPGAAHAPGAPPLCEDGAGCKVHRAERRSFSLRWGREQMRGCSVGSAATHPLPGVRACVHAPAHVHGLHAHPTAARDGSRRTLGPQCGAVC